jgi:hypothetical protein
MQRFGKCAVHRLSVQSIYEQPFVRTILGHKIVNFAHYFVREGSPVRQTIVRSLVCGCAVCLIACGQPQVSDLATRATRSVVPPTATALPGPVVSTGEDAIRVARTVVSPYIATWQDVVATKDGGVWRVVFRNIDPLPPGTMPNDDYWRIPLSVYIDATTGVVLRQGYV